LSILTRVGKNGRADTDNFVLRSMKTFKPVATLIFGWVDQDTVICDPTPAHTHRDTPSLTRTPI